MTIQHKLEGRDGRFYIEEDGKEIAFMSYVTAGPGKIIIEHTIVSPAAEGRGIGKQLVAAGVAHARENHLKIVPECSFARSVFEKTPEYADVLF